MTRSTLVLVHGSWHSTKHWQPIAEDLRSHGFKCVLVSLPSTQDPDTPPATLTDDTNAIRGAVVSELDSGNDVVVVAHSYGGCPANNALESLDTKSRTATGASTSVRCIVFISAFPLPAGMCGLEAFGGKPLPLHDLRVPEFAWVGAPGPEYYFYNDMEPEEARHWAGELRPQSWEAYAGRTSYAAYLDFPCHFLRCKKDQALTWEMSEGVIAAIERAGGASIQVEVIDSDHTPFLGKNMKKTSAYLRRIVNGLEQYR